MKSNKIKIAVVILILIVVCGLITLNHIDNPCIQNAISISSSDILVGSTLEPKEPNKSGNSSSSNKGDSSDKGSSGDKDKTPNKDNPAKDSDKHEHTHEWEAVYTDVPAKTHEERYVIKDAWTEYAPIYETKEVSVWVCNDCAARFSSVESCFEHRMAMNHGGAGVITETQTIQTGVQEIYHEPQYGYKTVIDEATTKKLSGYKCSCGATK